MRARATIFLVLVVSGSGWGVDNALRQRQETFRRAQERSFSSCPELPGSYTIGDLFRFRVVNGTIVLASPPPAATDNGTYRVKVDGMPGPATLGVGRTGPGHKPETITFMHYDFRDARATYINTSITWNASSLQISRHWQYPNGNIDVMFTQGEMALDDNAVAPAHPESAVAMIVRTASDSNDAPRDLEFAAPSLLAMRRAHPRELDEHLRPILRDLRMESLFAADPLAAWQVFVDDLKPEPAMTGLIQKLLPDLDSDSSRVREGALRTLQGKGLPMAIALTHFPREQLTPQQGVLLDAAIAPFKAELGEEPAKAREDPSFLIDCLYLDEPFLRRAATERLKGLTGRSVEEKVLVDPGARGAAIEELRSRIMAEKTRPGRP